MSLGARFNSGKRQLSFILEMPNAIASVAEVLEYGAEKYDRNNYKKGLIESELLDSTLRHLSSAFNNLHDDTDAESGLDHYAHAATNLMMLLELKANDSMPRYREHVGEMLKQSEEDLEKISGYVKNIVGTKKAKPAPKPAPKPAKKVAARRR
jgi:hypothetical protein